MKTVAIVIAAVLLLQMLQQQQKQVVSPVASSPPPQPAGGGDNTQAQVFALITAGVTAAGKIADAFSEDRSGPAGT